MRQGCKTKSKMAACQHVLLIQTVLQTLKAESGMRGIRGNCYDIYTRQTKLCSQGNLFLLKAIIYSEVFIPPNASLPRDYLN